MGTPSFFPCSQRFLHHVQGSFFTSNFFIWPFFGGQKFWPPKKNESVSGSLHVFLRKTDSFFQWLQPLHKMVQALVLAAYCPCTARGPCLHFAVWPFFCFLGLGPSTTKLLLWNSSTQARFLACPATYRPGHTTCRGCGASPEKTVTEAVPGSLPACPNPCKSQGHSKSPVAIHFRPPTL